MAPDIMVLQEGPDAKKEMNAFVEEYLANQFISVPASKRDKTPRQAGLILIASCYGCCTARMPIFHTGKS